jgi:hypothetical protein
MAIGEIKLKLQVFWLSALSLCVALSACTSRGPEQGTIKGLNESDDEYSHRTQIVESNLQREQQYRENEARVADQQRAWQQNHQDTKIRKLR